MAWYERFFGERYLREYADLLTPERTLADVESVIAILDPAPESRILDLCCGHGRHSVELAARGYRVCGQDLCELFLVRARETAAARDVELELLRGDMRTILHEPPFDAVINLFTAFGYFSDDSENRKVLAEVARVLRPGGRFLIEIVNRDGLMSVYRPRDWTRLSDGTVIVMERRFDAVAGTNWESRDYYYPDGRTERDETTVRLYTPTELVRMLVDVGLTVTAAYGGFDRRDLGPATTRMVLVTEKP